MVEMQSYRDMLSGRVTCGCRPRAEMFHPNEQVGVASNSSGLGFLLPVP